jgi:hypothetical protein
VPCDAQDARQKRLKIGSRLPEVQLRRDLEEIIRFSIVFLKAILVNRHVDVVVQIVCWTGSTVPRTIEQPKDQLPGCV